GGLRSDPVSHADILREQAAILYTTGSEGKAEATMTEAKSSFRGADVTEFEFGANGAFTELFDARFRASTKKGCAKAVAEFNDGLNWIKKNHTTLTSAEMSDEA